MNVEEERKRTRRVPYDDVRSEIRTGDMILFRGRGPFSRLLRWASSSNYSHMGIAAWWGERLVIFQSKIPVGVEVLPARRVVDRYDGQVDWWSIRPELADQLDRTKLVSLAVAELGKSYSWLSLVRFGWRLLRGRFGRRRDRAVLPESYYCSQYVSACYRAAGLDLVPERTDCCTSPGDIVRGGRVELRAVLRRPR